MPVLKIEFVINLVTCAPKCHYVELHDELDSSLNTVSRIYLPLHLATSPFKIFNSSQHLCPCSNLVLEIPSFWGR